MYTQEDHTNIPHKGPSPYSAMHTSQSLKMGYINCCEILNQTKPQEKKDNIHARYLKELALELTPAIASLFQTSIEQGKLSNDWLQAHIVPVLKIGDKILHPIIDRCH